MTRDDAAGLHARLMWLLEASGMSRTQIANGVGRNAGTITPWFKKTGWSLPDAKGLIGILRIARIGGLPVNANWLLLDHGAPTVLPEVPSALLYRGAQLVLMDVELALTQIKDRFAKDQADAAAAETPARLRKAAARVRESEGALKKAPGKRRRRSAE